MGDILGGVSGADPGGSWGADDPLQPEKDDKLQKKMNYCPT